MWVCMHLRMCGCVLACVNVPVCALLQLSLVQLSALALANFLREYCRSLEARASEGN